MKRTFIALFLILGFSTSSSLAIANEPAARWIVVTAPAFQEAIQPLVKHRQEQGFRVTVIATRNVLSDKELAAGDAAKLRQHVNKLCRDGQGTCYVLLVGAVAADKPDRILKTVVPPLAGTASRMKGQPSDNGYGCTAEGCQPTVAVGRMPARTEAEAQGMIAKTIAFEKDTAPGTWRRRITVLAGVPAFNPLVDKLVERLALSRFDRMDPRGAARRCTTIPTRRSPCPTRWRTTGR